MKEQHTMHNVIEQNQPLKNNYTNIPRIGVAVIIIKDDRVLIGKRKNSHGDGAWAFPGGHLEFFEHIEECARREVLEETGLIIDDVQFVALTNDFFEKENKHYITIFMKANHISGEPELKEPDKCEVWQWVTWENMPAPLFLPLQNLKKQEYNPFK